MVSARRCLGAAAGVGLDSLLGEPPDAWHPVVGFGRLMRTTEERLWRDRRAAGVAYAAVGVTAGVTAGHLTRSTAGATGVAVGGRSLDAAAGRVGEALAADDLVEARARLPWLVGRDPAGLDAAEISRAVVESVAENTVDAVVAPAFWAAAFGARGALGYRAINTLDAMVGHRSDRYARFGWAAARLDDVANWVPARLTALLVVVVRPGAARSIWRAVRQDAPAHPSPNSGVAEAAFAAALGVTLGGLSRYGDRLEQRPSLGDGRPVEPGDIDAARRLARDVRVALMGALVTAAGLSHVATCLRRRGCGDGD